MPNRLINETSPYLLQHANNPVDWYPWSAEALEKSKNDKKPILLSIGYSACHWCHVMEAESFENPQIASIMNDLFINIKVDREERPDIDAIFMEAVQMMTGSGGWPMTVFLTPEQQPFFSGTYFPPEDRHGMPGFPTLLRSISQAYNTKQEEIIKVTSQITEQIKQNMAMSTQDGLLSEEILKTAATALKKHFDYQNGGFGSSPKFPQPMTLEFLLQYFKTYKDSSALEMVIKTLDNMMEGGIYDQIGGGFHRYSTDSFWLVPHFEKMLYDNALLTQLYLNAYLITKNEKYKSVVTEVIDYTIRDMLDSGGGFYSSQDADSEGIEGKYFVWDFDELTGILPEDLATIAADYYKISPEGNFESKNILNIRDKKIDPNEKDPISVAKISQLNSILLKHRYNRIPPFKDDKIILSWNCMMLKALSEAATVLNRPDYLEIAKKNAKFLINNLVLDNGHVNRIWRDGVSKIHGALEDYALFSDGLLTLYENTLDQEYLQRSIEIANLMCTLFWEESDGCFYDTSSQEEIILTRPKTIFDNAQPCGASSATKILLKLYKLTGNPSYESISEKSLKGIVPIMNRAPSAAGTWLCCLDMYLTHGEEFVILHGDKSSDFDVLFELLHSNFLPNKVILSDVDNIKDYQLLQGKTLIDNKPTVFLCENHVCQSPTNNPSLLQKQILNL
ncbi:MAG TPA: thioredoxin domain-containing protein [Dehalococcoidia bacterium]|nr:thioredoxin domain-containing protein [Dehalococcoidia bacterium]